MILKNANLNGDITDITIENGRISAMGKVQFSENFIDLYGCEVYPGLADIHSHGCIGYDTMDEIGLEEMSIEQAKNGITSWLPTTMTVDFRDIKRVTNRNIDNIPGAQILGFHMEGPFINKKYKGAQNEIFIKKPDIAEYNTLKNIKMVTIAPELDGSINFIKQCNTIVSIGHTDADYETASSAFRAGAKCLTHTFNAMPPFHHRNPSVIGAAIDNDGYAQVISDGLHLHKSIVIALYRIFGADRMILISDSMRATGMCDGIYEFGGQEITVKNGVARTNDGSIAGSTTNLFDCVKCAIDFGIPKSDAFKMASSTPLTLIGAKNKGNISIGCDADIIAVDEDLNLVLSMSKGTVYTNYVTK